MGKYPKFTFHDLPKASVVNIQDNFDMEIHKEELINHAITEHLNTIMSEELDSENPSSNKLKEESDVIVDIEQVKLDSYHKGLDDARIKYENVINDINNENNFLEILKQKITELNPVSNIDSEIAKLSASIIATIARKVCLIMPVDFEQVLKSQLLSSLKKFYKEGMIVLTINPERYELSKNVLQLENLPAKLKENFEIIKDELLGINDCKLQWQDVSLKYDQEQLSSEIEEIIKQLK